MPLGGSPRSTLFWEPMLKKIARRLEGWERGFLSRGWIVMLISLVLDALTTYFMSLYRMPNRVETKVKKLMSESVAKDSVEKS
ncbi:hypothetical protein Syun_012450 [Stephania yunnanensis]|uniref:Uncharacterized protein n=1 Tax=Stephania yunnanensis TaxID=152371 RepID=A0AAP0PJ01_9MAGN